MMHRTDGLHDDAKQPLARGTDRAAAPTTPRFERGAAPSASKAEDIIALLNSRVRHTESRR